MIAHFFDLNTLIDINSKVWIVSKNNPNKPLIKLEQSEFNLIKSGIWRKTGTPLKISGTDYYIHEDLIESIKLKCKKFNVNITELSFSMQEFMNPEIIAESDFSIKEENLIGLKNSPDDIYIICSKNTKRNLKPIIDKLEKFLYSIGLSVKNYYYVSETFYNRDETKIAHKKIRLLLQHLIGLKTNDTKFSDEEITKYETVNFYEDDISTNNLTKKSNDVLKFLYDNSEESTKDFVKTRLNEELIINLNEVTHNRVNPFKITKIKLELINIFKTFESFNGFNKVFESTNNIKETVEDLLRDFSDDEDIPVLVEFNKLNTLIIEIGNNQLLPKIPFFDNIDNLITINDFLIENGYSLSCGEYCAVNSITKRPSTQLSYIYEFDDLIKAINNLIQIQYITIMYR
jgi:hypothetical protein